MGSVFVLLYQKSTSKASKLSTWTSLTIFLQSLHICGTGAGGGGAAAAAPRVLPLLLLAHMPVSLQSCVPMSSPRSIMKACRPLLLHQCLYFCASFCVSICTFGVHTHSSVILDKRLAFFLLGLGEIWDAFAHFGKRNRHLCIHIGVFEDLNGWYSVYLLYWYKTTDTEKFEAAAPQPSCPRTSRPACRFCTLLRHQKTANRHFPMTPHTAQARCRLPRDSESH